MDEDKDKPAEGVEGGKPEGKEGDDTLLLGRYKTSEDLAKAYTELQGQFQKEHTARLTTNTQLEAGGYQVTDTGEIVTPYTEESDKKDAADKSDEEDDWIDPRAKAKFEELEARLKGQERINDTLTRSIADTTKQTFLSKVPADLKKDAEQSFDAKVAALKPEFRDAGTLKLIGRTVLGEIVEKVGFMMPQGANQNVEDTSGVVEGTGNDSGTGARRLSPDEKKLYVGLGLKDAGLSEAQYAREIDAGKKAG